MTVKMLSSIYILNADIFFLFSYTVFGLDTLSLLKNNFDNFIWLP